jgi:hypothetical protein
VVDSDLESNAEISTDEIQTQAEPASRIERSGNMNIATQEVRKSSPSRNRSLSGKSMRSKTKRRGVKKSRKIKDIEDTVLNSSS